MLFLAKKIIVELLQYIFNGLEIESVTLNPEIKLFFDYISYEEASKQEINLASMIKVVVELSFALLQNTALPTNIKLYPDVDFYELTCPVKYESK